MILTTKYIHCYQPPCCLLSLYLFSSIIALHSEDSVLGVASLDSISASHGSIQTETEVMSGVLGRNDTIVL